MKTIGCSEDSQLYHNARDHYKSAMKKQQYTHILERYLTNDWYRQTLQSQGVTEDRVKEWDRLAEGPKREHVGTAAAREHWSNICHLKRTTAGGARVWMTVLVLSRGTLKVAIQIFDHNCLNSLNFSVPLPPPSNPSCRKLKSGIGNMSVDKATTHPRNNQIPAGSGKIGTISKVGIIQAHRQQDGDFYVLIHQNGRPVPLTPKRS